MKKGGIIAAIIIILIFIAIFIGLNIIKNDLSQPAFEIMRNFRFHNLSTDTETLIVAELTINNSTSKYINFNISYENFICDVFYLKQYIGSLFLNSTPFNLSEKSKNELIGLLEEYKSNSNENSIELRKRTKQKPRIFTTIVSGKKQTIHALFILSNENLSKVFYNHTMKNNERGKIVFDFNFSVEIEHPLSFLIPLQLNLTINVEKDIMTDMLEELDWMKYNKSFNKKQTLYNGRFINKTISISKNKESNIINVTKILFQKPKELFDFYIGDSCFWIKNADSYDIRFAQELIIYGKPWTLMLLNILFPLECNLTTNNETVIGSCYVQTVERDYGLTNSKRIELSATINGSKFGQIIDEHIKNDNYTAVNITNIVIHNAKFKKLMDIFPNFFNKFIPFDKINAELFNSTASISDLITEIELEDVSFDLNEAKQLLLFIQILTIVIIINTIIVVIILYFAFWKRGKYLVFK